MESIPEFVQFRIDTINKVVSTYRLDNLVDFGYNCTRDDFYRSIKVPNIIVIESNGPRCEAASRRGITCYHGNFTELYQHVAKGKTCYTYFRFNTTTSVVDDKNVSSIRNYIGDHNPGSFLVVWDRHKHSQICTVFNSTGVVSSEGNFHRR